MKKKETFHLMAVPRSFTTEVLKAGGRLMKLKNKSLDLNNLTLIQWKNKKDAANCILVPGQTKQYEAQMPILCDLS